ncbi:SMP-30/Gluconolaconase/LRE-like region-domain-containing protein [Tirmania nivea]|nr:SMP-30/Gluconolaconase/LRE-like region-domain-containing protein [Tirmania nivea]
MYDGEQGERMWVNDGGSPDDSTFYFTDTKKGAIFTYQFEASMGSISSQEAFINFTQQPPEKYGPSSPDGLAIDTNGDLWVAMFNGNAVVHIDGKTKEQKGKIEIPTSKQVAYPRFVPGGLLITTGKLIHMDPECEKGHSPHAGDVFFVKSEDIRGVEGREIYYSKI